MEKFLCLADENEPIAAEPAREAVRHGTVKLRTRWEDVHDDGYVDNADGHDVGHGPCLASRDCTSGARDCGMHKVPALVAERQPPALLWLLGLRVYLAVILAGNLLWEVLHLPLRDLDSRDPEGAGVRRRSLHARRSLDRREHSDACPPARGRSALAAEAILADRNPYTCVRPRLHGFQRMAERLRARSLGLFRLDADRFHRRPEIGLSPLLQWIVVPAAAFAIVRWVTTRHAEGGRP